MNNKALTVILGLVVLGGGYGLGRLATRDKDGSSPAGNGIPTAQGPSEPSPRMGYARSSRRPSDCGLSAT